MSLTTFFIILIVLACIVTILGVQIIKLYFQIYENILYPPKEKLTFKQEAKKRYERKINKTNATKRIQKTSKNL